MLASLAFLPLLAAAVSGQNASYVTDLLNTLNSLNLTSLASALTQANGSAEGRTLLTVLSNTNQNFTVFAPNNQGFSGAFPNATGNSAIPGLVGTLAYHVVSGSFNSLTQTYPNTTIGRTFLNLPNLVQLEGNKSQVVAWARWPSDNKTHVLNQNTNVTVLNAVQYKNLQVNVIDAVLDTPGNLTDLLAANNLTALATTLKAVPVMHGGKTSTLLEVLNSDARGYTLFAPTDAAFAAAASTITSLGGNLTAIMAVLGNHLVNGTTLYSPQLQSGTVTSASGQGLTASLNTTGTFVTAGSAGAMVTKPDLLLKNGVVHIIDHVLLNTEVNAAAASSAYQSATSAAGSAPSTTETSPVGATGPAAGSGSGASPSSTGSGAGAVRFELPMAGILAGVLGAVVGGVMTLA